MKPFSIARTAGLLLLLFGTVNGFAAEPGRDILDLHENRGGFAVCIGDEKGDLVVSLAGRAHYAVHGLLQEDAAVAGLRRRLREAGLYGKASVGKWSGDRLPYIDNLVNLLVCENSNTVDRKEILRVLAPKGLALLREAGGWEELRKPENPKTADWPQYLYNPGNNPVSKDQIVGPPRHLQWRGSPRWGRFHEKMSSFAAMVSTGGRVFYIMDEGSPASIFFPSDWQLTARDAYNGTVLWKKPIANWVWRFFPYKAGPVTVPRRLVATDDFVWVTLGIKAPVVKLCAKTGDLLKTYKGTEHADELVLSSGVLFLVVREDLRIPDIRSGIKVARSSQAPKNFWIKERKDRILAVEAESGKRLWEKELPVAPLTLGTDGTRVYLCDYDKVRAFDHASGKELWASGSLTLAKSYHSGMSPRLVVADAVVLFAGSENVNRINKSRRTPGAGWASPPDILTAISAETGTTLWKTDHPSSGFQSPEDIFVIKGTVWFGATRDGNGKGTFIGVNLKTGKVETTFEPDENSYWFHQRCYPQKATERYILTSRTGIEYVDPVARHWDLNHWGRGGCTYGVMPANGLTYAPQHPCACYPESKLSGMNAVAPARAKPAPSGEAIVRLTKGPGYENPLGANATTGKGDWPLLRHDKFRSSHAPVVLSGEPARAWS